MINLAGVAPSLEELLRHFVLISMFVMWRYEAHPTAPSRSSVAERGLLQLEGEVYWFFQIYLKKYPFWFGLRPSLTTSSEDENHSNAVVSNFQFIRSDYSNETLLRSLSK